MTEPRTLPGPGRFTLNERYWIRSIGCLAFGLPVVRLYWPASDPQPNISGRWSGW